MVQKKKSETSSLVPDEAITGKIFFFRGKRVMLDKDLAKLYGVTTGNLNKAVKRNISRFPRDFMFQLTKDEYHSLRFRFGILKRGQHSKYLPYAFTQEGVAMLSGVLDSERAVMVNIQIMRVFAKLREILTSRADLKRKIEQLEKKYETHDRKINIVFEAIKQLLEPIKKPKKKIGF